jgi:hypothetical protein
MFISLHKVVVQNYTPLFVNELAMTMGEKLPPHIFAPCVRSDEVFECIRQLSKPWHVIKQYSQNGRVTDLLKVRNVLTEVA